MCVCAYVRACVCACDCGCTCLLAQGPTWLHLPSTGITVPPHGFLLCSGSHGLWGLKSVLMLE